MVIMWGVVGGGLIAVCRCGSVCKQISAGSVSIEQFVAQLVQLAWGWDGWVVRQREDLGCLGIVRK